ncbi:facilitated trehalose transporter Tret1-like isoform X2 [Diaphorina citri]|nr:facilitated trehalose transporter Tret1-like isoform X2 [Diaphorina citri]
MDYIGRKWSLILVCVPYIISSLLTILADPGNIELLYLSKICAGIGGGMSTVAMVYVSEICHENFRPAILCLNSVFISCGILLTTILNLYLDWRSLSYCFLALVLISGLVLICFAPESPHWLINMDRTANVNKRMAKAEKSLKFLNRNPEIFEKEWRVLCQVRTRYDETRNKKALWRQILTTRECYKPLILLVILFTLQQFTGVYPVIFYAMQLFKEVGTEIDESHALVFLGIIRFGMSVVTTVLARGFGRKQLLIVSAAGLGVSSILLSSNLLMKSTFTNCAIQSNEYLVTPNESMRLDHSTWHNEMQVPPSAFNTSYTYQMASNMSTHEYNSSEHDAPHRLKRHRQNWNVPRSKSCVDHSSLSSDWLSLLFILLYVFFSAVGVIVIPWTMISELLPSYARGVCSGLMISYGYVCMFFMVKAFPFAIHSSVIGTFNVFGLVSFTLVGFVYFYLPETKGKTFVEIEKYFS